MEPPIFTRGIIAYGELAWAGLAWAEEASEWRGSAHMGIGADAARALRLYLPLFLARRAALE